MATLDVMTDLQKNETNFDVNVIEYHLRLTKAMCDMRKSDKISKLDRAYDAIHPTKWCELNTYNLKMTNVFTCGI